MSRISVAAMKGDIQRTLSLARKDIEKLVAETSGANSEPVKQAAFALGRQWRKVLSTPGSRTIHSEPGQAPRMQTRRLRKSIKTAVVEGIRRVGSGSYVARLLEFGYNGRGAFSNARLFSKGKVRLRKAQGPASPPIAPRPHASVALELAKDEMTDVLVTEMQRRVPRGGVR